MAKVVLLSCSPNKNGNTIQVLEKMAEAIREKGLDAEVLSLSGLNLADSMSPAALKDKDGFDKIVAKIKAAEGFIVGSPVYWGTMRAETMTALQRLAMASAADNNFLHGKVGGPVAIARRGGTTSSIQEALMFYLYHDMIIVGSTYWNMVFGKTPGEALKDEEGMRTVIHFAENVANVITKLYK